MSTLAHDVLATSHGHLGKWAARAWHRMGWRHVLLALAVHIVDTVAHPLGGEFLMPTEAPTLGLVVNVLSGRWVVGSVAIVYGVLVADEAFNEGVSPLRAYGLAVVALAAFVPVVDWHLAGLMGQPREAAPQMVWFALVWLFQGGLAMSIYAYWRVTQRTMRQAQAAETERARNEQRVRAARLLVLQSRVEPQMLFDALGRIGELHVREPQAADALLADLIALLRAMLPGARTDDSTVEREFALIEAWLRVARNAAHGAARAQLRMTPDARSISIAPMLLLPLLRAVLVLPRAERCEWVLSAHVTGDRLIVGLQANADASAEVASLLAGANLSSLHDRLAQLFGRMARLTVSSKPPALTLDLPRLQEDPDDDRPDR